MKLGQIVLKLRLANGYFGNYIAGCAELDLAIEETLSHDMAFVIPLMEDATANQHDVGIDQKIIERFAVVIALTNDDSQNEVMGFESYDKIHEIRNDFFKALVGWMPIDSESSISYRGGRLLDINNGFLWWQFEFEFESRIEQIKASDGSMYAGISQTNFDSTETPVDFNTVYMQLISMPDQRIPYLDEFGNPGKLPYEDNFPNVKLPDTANWIDLKKNPYAGSFSKSFTTGFDKLKQ